MWRLIKSSVWYDSTTLVVRWSNVSMLVRRLRLGLCERQALFTCNVFLAQVRYSHRFCLPLSQL